MLKTMKLQRIISRLEKHHKKKIDLTLGRTFNLLKKLGNPQGFTVEKKVIDKESIL